MKNIFKQIVFTFVLLLTCTFLFAQVNMLADIPDRAADDPVYAYVEKMPHLSGTNKIQQYIDDYPYPQCGLDNNLQGKVVLQLIVERTGEISTIKIVKSPDPCLSDAAIDYLLHWPKWEPAYVNDIPVSCLFTLPIDYNIEQYNTRPK